MMNNYKFQIEPRLIAIPVLNTKSSRDDYDLRIHNLFLYNT